MFIFVLINYRGVKVSGRWQNAAFVFFFWSVSAVWMLIMIHNIDFFELSARNAGYVPGIQGMDGDTDLDMVVLCRV